MKAYFISHGTYYFRRRFQKKEYVTWLFILKKEKRKKI